jgi:hypothetical protein
MINPEIQRIKMQNKLEARHALGLSDWASLPDVNLANKQEWLDYRASLRAMVTTPPETEVELPQPPQIIWA